MKKLFIWNESYYFHLVYKQQLVLIGTYWFGDYW